MQILNFPKQNSNGVPSIYAQYAKERAGRETIESEFGFATYTIYKDHVYIEDVFIVPEHRKSKICIGYVNDICKLAKKSGVDKVVTSVSPLARGATVSIKVILALGFELLNSTNDLIYFSKRIL